MEKGLAELQREWDDIERNVVQPSYKKFCLLLDLPFHFWDECPHIPYDSRISLEEDMIRSRCRLLFNTLKPDGFLYNGNVIEYFFYGGTFRHSIKPLSDAMGVRIRQQDMTREVAGLSESSVRLIIGVTSLLSAAPSVALLMVILHFWKSISTQQAYLIGLVGIVSIVIFTIYADERATKHFLVSRPKARREKQIRGIIDEIIDLRRCLNSIRGSGKDPLENMHGRGQIFSRLSQAENLESMEDAICELKKELSVLPYK